MKICSLKGSGEMANEMKFNEAREHNKRRIVTECYFSLSPAPFDSSDTAQAGENFH